MSVSIFGILAKRAVLRTYSLEDKRDIVMGGVTIFASVSVYVIGTFLLYKTVLHFESLLLFVTGYLLVRYDKRLIRLTLPLLFTIALSFALVPIQYLIGLRFLEILFPSVLVGLFALYLAGFLSDFSNGSVKQILEISILPTLTVALASIGWMFRLPWFFVSYLPLPLILLSIPAFQTRLETYKIDIPFVCRKHRGDATGFCMICGSKFESPARTKPPGILGLLLAVTVVVMVLVAQIPLITLHGSVPFSDSCNYAGVSVEEIPPVPPGWLINSSSNLNLEGDTYAISRVLVPVYHPEVSNYTEYFELSLNSGNVSESWGTIPGWNRTSELFDIGGQPGTLVTYTKGNLIQLVYFTESRVMVLNDSTFIPMNIWISIIREFKTGNIQVSKSQFATDTQNLFLFPIDSWSYASYWASFLVEAQSTIIDFTQLGILIISVIAIFFVTYRLDFYDRKLQNFVDRTFDLSDDEYHIILKLMQKRARKKTASEIFDFDESIDLEAIAETLSRLEEKSLVKKTLVRMWSEVRLTWKANL